MIRDKKRLELINEFLIKLLLKKVKPEVLMNAIDNALEKSFEDGKNLKSREICKALGLF
jgi:hypothetical protein